MSLEKGHSYNKSYGRWYSMLDRCNNKKHKSYSRYGGRGIKVCERWLSYENFREDMGEPPRNHSLDRINNNLGYSKENCRWTNQQTQANNTRSNRLLTFRGETKSASDWCREFNMKQMTLYSRLRRGASIEEALTSPLKDKNLNLNHKLTLDDALAIRKQYIKVHSSKSNARELAKKYGVSITTIQDTVSGRCWKHAKELEDIK